MATLLFYEEPVALNREEHKNLRLRRLSTMDFTKNVNSVPAAGVEFFSISRDFPVVFIKDSSGEYIPVALLSFKAAGHSLGDDWSDVYTPAFIRRYPFALSSDGMVIMDKQAPHLQEEEGERLFKEEDGENAEQLTEVIKFLHDMDRHYKMTREFSQALAERELLEPFNVQVNLGEENSIRLSSLSVINEKKFSELPEADVQEFFKKGWLAWAYAHLHSLSAVSRVARRDREAAEAEKE